MDQNTIYTERLMLRPVNEDDRQKVFEGFSHPEVTRYFDITYSTYEDTAEQMKWYAQNRKNKTGYAWAVCNRENNQVMGVFSIYRIDKKHHRCELGYWLLPPYWNKGYGTEGLKAILNYLTGEMGMHRISAEVEPENMASQKLLATLGFVREGVLRDYEIKNNKYQDLEIWGKVFK